MKLKLMVVRFHGIFFVNKLIICVKDIKDELWGMIFVFPASSILVRSLCFSSECRNQVTWL